MTLTGQGQGEAMPAADIGRHSTVGLFRVAAAQSTPGQTEHIHQFTTELSTCDAIHVKIDSVIDESQ